MTLATPSRARLPRLVPTLLFLLTLVHRTTAVDIDCDDSLANGILPSPEPAPATALIGDDSPVEVTLPSPVPTPATALIGQSCLEKPCDSSYCNPATKVCGDWPAVGETCATEEAAGTEGQRCCVFCQTGGALCDDCSGLCVERPQQGNSCDPEDDQCSGATTCVAPNDGGPAVCMLAGRLGDLCSDALNVTCWRDGLPFGRALDTATQDLVCDSGVCAEDKEAGLATSCISTADCESSGYTCAAAQDGKSRCLKVVTNLEVDECYRGKSYEAVSLNSCPVGSSCDEPALAPTQTDFQLGFCFQDTLLSKGQACNALGGGKKCAEVDENGEPLSCQFYSPLGDNIAASSVCVATATAGGSCNGDSFAACTPEWPATGNCQDGKCVVDSSALPPCAQEQQVINVLNPRNISQSVEVCVNYQVEQGGKCQVAAPPLEGAVYQSLRCKEGLLCKQPATVARFNVEGKCAVFVGEGEQCSGETVACSFADGFSCIDGTCQKGST